MYLTIIILDVAVAEYCLRYHNFCLYICSFKGYALQNWCK